MFLELINNFTYENIYRVKHFFSLPDYTSAINLVWLRAWLLLIKTEVHLRNKYIAVAFHNDQKTRSIQTPIATPTKRNQVYFKIFIMLE